MKVRVTQQGAHLAADGLIHLGDEFGTLRIGLGLDIRRHDIAEHGLKIIERADGMGTASAGFSRGQRLLEQLARREPGCVRVRR